MQFAAQDIAAPDHIILKHHVAAGSMSAGGESLSAQLLRHSLVTVPQHSSFLISGTQTKTGRVATLKDKVSTALG